MLNETESDLEKRLTFQKNSCSQEGDSAGWVAPKKSQPAT